VLSYLRHALPVEANLADASDLREDVINRLAANAPRLPAYDARDKIAAKINDRLHIVRIKLAQRSGLFRRKLWRRERIDLVVPSPSAHGKWEIVQGLPINHFSRAKIDASVAELKEEKSPSELISQDCCCQREAFHCRRPTIVKSVYGLPR